MELTNVIILATVIPCATTLLIVGIGAIVLHVLSGRQALLERKQDSTVGSVSNGLANTAGTANGVSSKSGVSKGNSKRFSMDRLEKGQNLNAVGEQLVVVGHTVSKEVSMPHSLHSDNGVSKDTKDEKTTKHRDESTIHDDIAKLQLELKILCQMRAESMEMAPNGYVFKNINLSPAIRLKRAVAHYKTSQATVPSGGNQYSSSGLGLFTFFKGFSR